MRKNAKKPPRAVPPAKNESLKVSGRPWQIQLAKARFSELFRLARTEGPQRITRQGRDAVVLISDEQFARLVGKSHQPKSLVQFPRITPGWSRTRPGTPKTRDETSSYERVFCWIPMLFSKLCVLDRSPSCWNG